MPGSWLEPSADFLATHPNVVSWIVRSSFDCEDAEELSFAGCFESVVVNKPNARALSRAMHRVLSSVLTERANSQILAAGLNPSRVRFGVIVQEYISGEVSGVGFTRDPDDIFHYASSHEELNGFCEWTKGGCESITDGSESGQRAWLSKKPPDDLAPFWKHLNSGALRLETLFCAPMDFEWTYAKGKLWWLQARPIATEEARIAHHLRGAKFGREKIAERFPDVMTPLGWSLVEDALLHSLVHLEGYFGIKCTNMHLTTLHYRGYIYANESYLSPKNCGPTAKLLGNLAMAIPSALWSLGKSQNRQVAILEVMHRRFLKAVSTQVLHDWNTKFENHVREIREFDVANTNLENAQSRFEAIRSLSFSYFETDIAIHLLKEIYADLLGKCCFELGMPSVEVFAKVDKNASMEMHRHVQNLTEALRTDSNARLFLQALEKNDISASNLNTTSQICFRKFLDHCGHMSSGWDVTSTFLGENGPAMAHLFARGMQQSECVRGEFDCEVPETIREPMDFFQRLCQADETQHFYGGLYLQKSRDLLLLLGKDLVRRECCESFDDLFYLTVDEIERFLLAPEWSLTPLVTRRRRLWENYRKSPARSHPAQKEVHLPPETAGNRWRGIGASPGRASGTLVVVNSFDDLRNLPHDAILAIKSPNPSYVPWFDLCRGVVTETGGMLSHGFIAAREMQVPAVSGISLAALRHNSHVIVDGNLGEVSCSPLAIE